VSYASSGLRNRLVTLLASMSLRGMGPCLVVEGSTTTAVFEAYLEQVLTPSLGPGQVVMMDNLSSHKGSRVRELIEERGCELMYLPPYSPISIPSKKRLPSSRRCCGELGHVLARHS
jgi:DDE superfamily endonuclease